MARSLFGCMAGQHMGMRDYQIAFSGPEFSRFFKFTFVRNPWDRVVSAYHFLKAGGINAADAADADRIIHPFENFEDFVRGYLASGERGLQRHFVPQYRFLCTQWNGPPKVDFIGRFEQIEADYQHICARLNIENALEANNKTKSRPRDFRDEYSAETAEIVGQVYARDVELFGYSFDG
ncbi:MAG: sulfotransferase family 2 domain-containing protein [Pseudomonadota bacterium]